MRIDLILLVLTFFVTSCGASLTDYSNAARDMCTCVSGEQEKEETRAKDVLFYAKCSAEVEEKYNISIEDQAFDQAMTAQCMGLLELHQMIKTKIIGTLDYE